MADDVTYQVTERTPGQPVREYDLVVPLTNPYTPWWQPDRPPQPYLRHLAQWADPATAAPLADFPAARHRLGQPFDHLVLSRPAYRVLRWPVTVASVQYLPKRTRKRLLARLRRDIMQTGG